MTDTPNIAFARVYDEIDETQGVRLLVDRVWPRGISKDDLELDDWIREVAPSTGLRKWFGPDPGKWEDFRARYRFELDKNPEAVGRCLERARKGPVTLLYAAHNRDHNQAAVLCDYLRERLARPPAD